MDKDTGAETPKTYALVSHESAVEAIWALAARNWKGVQDNEAIWLVPSPESCVRTQGDLKRLAQKVDLEALGIRRRPVDLLVPNNSCYSRGKQARFHVWQDFFPPRSFVRVHDRVLVSTPYFTALQLAMTRKANKIARAEAEESASIDAQMRAELGLEGKGSTAEELLRWKNIARLARATQVLCDFMGTYRYAPQSDAGSPSDLEVVFDTKPILRAEALRAYLDELGSVWGIRRARRVASLAFTYAASPMETMLAIMLTFPLEMGGFGLPRPTLNQAVPIESSERELVSQKEIVADLCWAQSHVIVEYYGWNEHFGKGPRKVAADAKRANSLAALGWSILHVTYEQVRSVSGVTLLARQLGSLLGISLAVPTELELVWRSRLLALLLPRVRI